MEKLGTTPAKGQGFLPLNAGREGHGFREAIQRLNDPERRLVDEFFWFWPHTLGQSKDDKALQALSQGDGKGAVAIWFDQEKTRSESNVSMHNLAVFSHATALDLEQLGRSLTAEERKDLEYHWKQAFTRWRILLDYEGFWSRLTARIRDLDDPRLTTGTARRIKNDLPVALLFINASLAVRAAEREDAAEAARQVTLVAGSGFPESIVTEALHRAVKPVRDRIKLLCANAASESDADPVHADKVALRLIENSRMPLSVLNRVLPQDDATREAAHDEVALKVLSLQVAFGNKTENWKVSLDLLKQALSIAVGAMTRSRIEENEKVVAGNLEYQQTYETCWFCKTNPADEKSKIEMKMHGDVARTPNLYGGTRITWNHITIGVPRCRLCKKRHEWRGGGLIFAYLGGFILTCVITAEFNLGGAFLWIWAFAVLSGYKIGELIYVKAKREPLLDSADQSVKTMRVGTRKNFPPIRDRLKKGWKWGEKPA